MWFPLWMSRYDKKEKEIGLHEETQTVIVRQWVEIITGGIKAIAVSMIEEQVLFFHLCKRVCSCSRKKRNNSCSCGACADDKCNTTNNTLFRVADRAGGFQVD